MAGEWLQFSVALSGVIQEEGEGERRRVHEEAAPNAQLFDSGDTRDGGSRQSRTSSSRPSILVIS